MGEQRQYTDGQKQFLISDKEAAALNLNRPAYLPPITPVDDKAKIRANYRNNAGELVDTILDAENVRKRANLGENVVADKASIEQARGEAVVRERIHMADQEDFTTLVNAALPGAQFLQNIAVGENDANQARQDLSVNMAANVVGNIAEFAIGGKMVGLAAKGLLGASRAGKLGVTLGLSKDSAKLAKVGRVAAEEVLMDTHFFVQNNLDTGGEMEAEEWGRLCFTVRPWCRGARRRTGHPQGHAGLRAATDFEDGAHHDRRPFRPRHHRCCEGRTSGCCDGAHQQTFPSLDDGPHGY